MGEYADMMVDGTCCQGCGGFMGDTPGHPRFCDDCGGDPRTQGVTQKPDKPYQCTTCKKRFGTKQGMFAHARAVHGD